MYEMLKTAFGEQATGRSQTFQWFSWFKAGRTSTDDDERSGRPVSRSMPEMIERVRQIVREDRCHIIDEVSMLACLLTYLLTYLLHGAEFFLRS